MSPTDERAEHELAVTRENWCFTNAAVWIENHADALIARARDAKRAEALVAALREALKRLLKHHRGLLVEHLREPGMTQEEAEAQADAGTRRRLLLAVRAAGE